MEESNVSLPFYLVHNHIRRVKRGCPCKSFIVSQSPQGQLFPVIFYHNKVQLCSITLIIGTIRFVWLFSRGMPVDLDIAVTSLKFSYCVYVTYHKEESA